MKFQNGIPVFRAMCIVNYNLCTKSAAMFVDTCFYMVISIYPWSLLFVSLMSEKTVSHCFDFHFTDDL